jgi:hypothetical protein
MIGAEKIESGEAMNPNRRKLPNMKYLMDVIMIKGKENLEVCVI